MAELNEHPDLVKLELSVREIVRAVFCNSENGTPDNISKAGCAALAFKGQNVWNEWRNLFPTKHFTKGKDVPHNFVNFKGEDLSGLNFSGFEFGDYADFRSTYLGIAADFSSARFGAQANFSDMSCESASFANCAFSGSAIFKDISCESWISFYRATFHDIAIFNGSHLNTANLQADFRGKLELSAVQVDDRLDLSVYGKITTLSSVLIAGSSFKHIDFSGRVFGAKTTFEKTKSDILATRHGRTVNDLSLYRSLIKIPMGEPTKFLSPPIFHGCNLYQDTSFEDAKFPAATGTEGAARAYRTLKLAFSQQQATHEEQRFFKLEMEEETLRERGLKRWLFVAYKWSSDFGFSVARPLALLVVLWIVFAQVYGQYSGTPGCIGWTECHLQSNWLQYSAAQALPLPGFDKLEFFKHLNPSVGWVALHKTLSLAALFLVGLALRNLFKLK